MIDSIKMGKVVSIKGFTKNDFEALFFDQNLPFLLTDIDTSAPAYEKWTFEYFKSIGEKCIVPVSDDLNQPANITRKIKLSNYIDELKTSPTCPYMMGWSYQKDFPALDQDYDLPQFHPQDFIEMLPSHLRFRRKWIFIGKKNVGSDLHVDSFSMSAWIQMIKGQKTIRCISPSDKHNVSQESSLFDPKTLSAIAKKNIDVFEFELRPGTLFYNPSDWLHQVHNDTDTIMVTGGFVSKNHVFQFYSSFYDTISNDTYHCDVSYLEYIKKIAPHIKKVNDSSQNAIMKDISRIDQLMENLASKKKIYQSLL